jgi:hypothetical protein
MSGRELLREVLLKSKRCHFKASALLRGVGLRLAGVVALRIKCLWHEIRVVCRLLGGDSSEKVGVIAVQGEGRCDSLRPSFSRKKNGGTAYGSHP